MPSGHDRRGIFASRDDSPKTMTYAPPLERDRLSERAQEQPCRRQRGEATSQRTVPAPQGQYHAYTPHYAQVSQYAGVDSAASRNNIVEHMTSVQYSTVIKARRSNHIVDDAVHRGLVAPESPREAPQNSIQATQAKLLSERRSSYFAGCVPVDSYHPSAQHRDGRDRTPQHLTVPGQYDPADPSHPLQSRHRPHNKPLPPPPPLRQVMSPHEGLRITNPDPMVPVPLCPDDHQTGIAGQNELWFGNGVPNLYRSSLADATFQTPPLYPTRSSTQVYFELPSGMHSIPNLESPDNREEEQAHHQDAAQSDDGPPVLPDMGPIMTDPLLQVDVDQQEPAVTWYDHFREIRTWDFDETMEARYRMMMGSNSVSDKTERKDYKIVS